MPDPVLYAHTLEGEPEERWQTLRAHAEGTAELAARFASAFGAEEFGRLAGLLHDAGKANSAFQARLHGSSERVDHATAGARYLCERYPQQAALLASVIAGHHGGLPNTLGEPDGSASLRTRFKRFADEASAPWYPDAIEKTLDLPAALDLPLFTTMTRFQDRVSDEGYFFNLYTLSRLLYSSLVDADWLDTERFINPDIYAERMTPHASIQELLSLLTEHTQAFAPSNGTEVTPVNIARNAVLEDCCRVAEGSVGIYTLEVPTGGGKTLSSMAFALRHAVANGLDRVIYAIPYTSIVEQIAGVFKDIFGAHNVLEHHSNYDYGLSKGDEANEDTAFRERLLTQNWDAPIVVTTNVQLLESLFAALPSRSRKVHNIAKSVVVLDEVQTLPDRLLKSTLAMFESMAHLGVTSFVLCSATQPALEKEWPFKTSPIPIIHDRPALERAFGGRVTFDTSRVADGAITLDVLIDELIAEPQVLCVVSSRKAARLVFEALRDAASGETDGLFHLSAFMVPAHRSEVIARIRERLATGLPCRVVSTQLIEAGVDLDFPVLYRETAGIDSMLQAAGRCNRNGLLAKPGRAVIFDCSDFPASKAQKTGWLATQRALGLETIDWGRRDNVDPFGREGVQRYFVRRHQTAQTLDDGNIYRDLTRGALSNHIQPLSQVPSPIYTCEFRDIAAAYRIIDNDEVSVFVPWGRQGEELLERMESGASCLGLSALVQRFSVSIPPWFTTECRNAGALRTVGPWLAADIGFGSTLTYDELGLGRPADEPSFDFLIL